MSTHTYTYPVLALVDSVAMNMGYIYPFRSCFSPQIYAQEWDCKVIWQLHAMEYYSGIKKDEIMLFATTCMAIEIVILSEVSQTEQEKYYMTSLICGV